MPWSPTGFAEEGYAGVAAAFAEVLESDHGAASAFSVYRDGRRVVDLWGGVADRPAERLADRNTMHVVFSGSKGLVAVCMLILLERGQLELVAPVARYWPEFAAQGKAAIRVSDVVSHQAGLPGFALTIAPEDILDDVRMAELLAAQAPDRDPRAARSYHPYSFGWLCGELIRRVDGRSVGDFFAQEVAQPLELDLWIGLPQELERRVSRLELASQWGGNVRFDPTAGAGDLLRQRVYWNPQLFIRTAFPWNTPAFHRAEIPAANAIGSAPSIARLYGCLANGGSLDGVRILNPSTVELGARCLSRRQDPLTDDPVAFGVGFWLQTELAPYGPAERAFGHGGSGGSMHGAWPREGTGFSFCTNLLRDDEGPDGRAGRLLTSLADALG